MSFSSLHRGLTNSVKPSTSTRSAHRPSLATSSRAPSRALNTQTPRSSRSLRQLLSRRLKRKSSEEDIFTEIGSDADNEEEVDDPTLFPPQEQHPRTLTPSRPPPSAYHPHSAGISLPPKDGQIVVFPERRMKPLPPLEKDAGLSCANIVCLEPSSPTHLLHFPLDLGEKERDVEKGETSKERSGDETEAGAADFHPQSPHLGHRGPHWKNRQSIHSHLSTGHWEKMARRRWWIALGFGAGLLVILIIGLLAGLLTRRSDR